MKPIFLRMSAFGAFAGDTGFISFEPFENPGIFLITGETGAGKTTIFDAICFALYGTASGDVRDPKQFRSQYADPYAQTFVDFMFSCGKESYLVHRMPSYLRPALRGNEKMVEQKPEAQLFLIEEKNNKKQILKEGPQEVTDAITKLTGLDGKQFRQIVMIAQGEFRKFLLSSSKEKETILRQLFHTQDCEKIGQLVKEHFDAQKNLVQEQETTILTLLHQVQPNELEQKQEYLRILAESGVGAAESLCEMLDHSSEQLAATLAEQTTTLQEIEQKQDRLVREMEQGRQHNVNFERLKEQTAGLQQETEALEKCRKNAALAEQEAKQLPELQQRITVLKHSLPAYTRAAQLRQEGEKLQKQRKAQEQACGKAKTAWEQTNDSCRRLSEELEVHTDLALRIAQLEHDIEEEDRQQNMLRQLEKLLKQLQTAHLDYAAQARRAELANSNYYTVEKPTFDQIEKRFFQSMAGNLAQQLQENQPCPVCGSCTHPNPAQCTEETVTEEQYQKAKAKHQDAVHQLEEERSRLAQQKERYEALKQQCTQQARQCAVSDNTNIADVQNLLKQSVLSVRKNQDVLTAAKKQRQLDQQKKQLLEQQQEKLPLLQQSYENSHAELERLQMECVAKEAEQKQCRSDLAYASLEQAQAQLEQLQCTAVSLEQAQRQATDALYQQREKTASQKKVVQHLLEIVGEIPKYDLDAARLKQEQMRNQKKQLEQTIQHDREQRRQFLQIAASVRSQNEKLAVEAKRKVQMEQLHKMLNGTQKGRERISFERYVQTYYFNRVLAFANQKLYQLSGGRYLFQRRQEEMRFNISGGLNLDVLDQYTGKTRCVETLSGGETFLASLALALGLSDAVQQQSGGIQMNAMFIDEGFGSLDSTALDNAVRVLQQLSDHQRMIGIISHVSELSERFDAQIRVKKTDHGSHITCLYM